MAADRLIQTQCVFCGTVHTRYIPMEKYIAWRIKGQLIQDVFPDMSSDEREILISGTCCWDAMFSEEDK